MLTLWLWTYGLLPVAISLAGFFLVVFVVDRWRARETDLATTSEQLARANELISRYVATQVAQQIHAGNYNAVARHDRRKLTLFFSDIKSFTEIADAIEPEELSRILNEYLSEMTAIAERYEATIDKFVGDAIMIFFGAPTATHDRDHALRAVRMAMEMQDRLVVLRERWRKEGIEELFQIRIGINTGVASVGNFGSSGRVDYTAIGRQVNLAARLQVNCDPGKILLSHTAWVLVRDEIPCIAKGDIQVKGFHQPVTVYEVAAGAGSGA
jgi:class 3 adenylate cyclase